MEGQRMTNADKIRSMSDEELATWLNTMQSNAWHSGRLQKTPNKYPSTNQTWLDWLKQETDNGQN